MTPIDVGLAAAGWLAAAVERRTGSRRGTAAVVLGLVLVSAVITYSIGSSRRPTDVSFDDVRLDRLPAVTSWVRLEGELRQLPSGSGYELHDTANDALYLYVIAHAPLVVGHVVMTGTVSPRQATTGNIGTIVADITAEPKRNEPFGLILLPAALGSAPEHGVPMPRADCAGVSVAVMAQLDVDCQTTLRSFRHEPVLERRLLDDAGARAVHDELPD